MKLAQAKRRATLREHARVYDGMNLPPRDIVVEWHGETWVRYSWTSLNRFGWGHWVRVA